MTLDEKIAVSTIKNAIRGQFTSSRPHAIKKCQCCGTEIGFRDHFIGSICWKCGWEQDLIESDSEKSSMNYNLTPVEYRKLYNEVVNGEI